jgi:hypothetical protein
VLVVGAGGDRGVRLLTSAAANDRSPRREEDAERNAGGDETRKCNSVSCWDR